jgi:hypothetical protein
MSADLVADTFYIYLSRKGTVFEAESWSQFKRVYAEWIGAEQ